MKKPWLLVAWLLVIELLAILLLIPGDWTDRAIKRESELVEQSLGRSKRLDTEQSIYLVQVERY
ncbi:hypothetical protein NDJ44_22130 [Escherichia coli]|uniref:hypothetical protein n=1 Tax=Escherichia coli TaxID=562 RepID=UPI0020C7B629|nr:hypothetical protein [Escherichia coli]MCP8724372.1 hypothetical protein [Escherichia coli]